MLTLSDSTSSGELAIGSEQLRECRITTQDIEIRVGDLPMQTYDGIALRYVATFDDETYVFGSGTPVVEG